MGKRAQRAGFGEIMSSVLDMLMPRYLRMGTSHEFVNVKVWRMGKGRVGVGAGLELSKV